MSYCAKSVLLKVADIFPEIMHCRVVESLSRCLARSLVYVYVYVYF